MRLLSLDEIKKKIVESKIYSERQVKMAFFGYKNYRDGKTQIWSCALTYFSILAVVPLFSLMFGIAKGFGLNEFLEEKLREVFIGNEVVIKKILEISNRLIDSTKGSILTGGGIIIFVWSIMKLFLTLENSFNYIWEVNNKRAITRRVSDYIVMIFLGPILIMIVFSLNTVITDYLISLFNLKIYHFFITIGLAILEFLFLSLLFTVIYVVVPNTKVNFRPAFSAGVITAVVFHILKFVFTFLQFSITRYNAVYGSLSFIPIFLVWCRYIWLTILIGAQISFSSQNFNKYTKGNDLENMSFKMKKDVSILILYILTKRFEQGEEPYTDKELADELEIPIGIVRHCVSDLEKINLVNILEKKNDSIDGEYLQIGKDINNIYYEDVIEEVENINLEYFSEIKISSRYKNIIEFINNHNKVDNKILIKDVWRSV